MEVRHRHMRRHPRRGREVWTQETCDHSCSITTWLIKMESIKTCPYCGDKFKTRSSWQVTCGKTECQFLNHKLHRYIAPIKEKFCAICGSIFTPVRRDQNICRNKECKAAWTREVRLTRIAQNTEEQQRKLEICRKRWISRRRRKSNMAEVSC